MTAAMEEETTEHSPRNEDPRTVELATQLVKHVRENGNGCGCSFIEDEEDDYVVLLMPREVYETRRSCLLQPLRYYCRVPGTTWHFRSPEWLLDVWPWGGDVA